MVDYTSTGIIFTFKRKVPNRGQLARYLAQRAASELTWKQWREDKTLPAFPPSWVTVELHNADDGFFMTFNFRDYFMRMHNLYYNEDTKQFFGSCELFKEDMEGEEIESEENLHSG